MNKATQAIFKQLKKKHKNIKLRKIVECVCKDIEEKSKTGVKMQELFERTEEQWPGSVLLDIERRCINNTIRKPQRDDIIKNFFEPFMKCPDEIKDCQKLREDFDRRYDILKKTNQCTDCNITHLKYHFIKTVLEKNIII